MICIFGLHDWSEWSHPMKSNSDKYQWRICNNCKLVSYHKIKDTYSADIDEVNKLLDEVVGKEKVEVKDHE